MDEKIMYDENEVVVTTMDEIDVTTDIVTVDSEKSEIGAGEYAIIGLAGAGAVFLVTLAYKGGKKLVTLAKDKFGKKRKLEDFEEDEEFEDIADEIQEELEEDLNKKK